MIEGFYIKGAVNKTNNSDFRPVVFVFHQRVVVFVAMNSYGIRYELIGCFAMSLGVGLSATFSTSTQ
jgi:hypothetical protein